MDVYVATLDTGGISYSGVEYIAVGKTEQEAREAIAGQWHEDAGEAGLARLDLLDLWNGKFEQLADELNDYYGIRVTKCPIGKAVQSS